MKIAMLTNNYRPFVGGVPISVERQAHELIRLGHEVTVFAPEYGDTAEEDAGAPERIVRYHIQKKRMDNGMVYPGVIPLEILREFRKERYDCIHVHHPMFVGTVRAVSGKEVWDPGNLYISYTLRGISPLYPLLSGRGEDTSTLEKDCWMDPQKSDPCLYEMVCRPVRHGAGSVGGHAPGHKGLWDFHESGGVPHRA